MRCSNTFQLLPLLLVILLASSVHSSNILFYFGITAHSHLSSIWPLIEALSVKGHNVTVLTSFKPRTSDGSLVNVIFVKEIFDVLSSEWDEDADLIQARVAEKQRDSNANFFHLGVESCKITLNSSYTRDVVYNSQFDLVIIDSTFNQCAVLLATYKWNASFAFYHAVPFHHGFYDDFGVPLETFSIPDVEYGNPLTFTERFLSTYRVFELTRGRRQQLFEPLAQVIREVLHLDYTPSIPDLLAQTRLLLYNGHYVTDYSRSLPSLFVPVAGIQIDGKQNPIPNDTAKFIDRLGPGCEGFIYVSFGTAVRISKANPEIKRKLFGAMGSFNNLRFVWKWDAKSLPVGAPANIYFSEWLPQLDLFAHPKIKGYMGHGGRNGIHEAIYYGLPMILFPIFGDQDYNANSLREKGLATVIEITDFTQDELQSAITNLASNSTLKEQMMEASRIFKDRPMKPIDTAFWWIEYVLRHPTSNHMVPPGIHQSIIERRYLDIIAFVFLSLAIVLGLLCVAAYQFLYYVSRKPGICHSNGKSKMQ